MRTVSHKLGLPFAWSQRVVNKEWTRSDSTNVQLQPIDNFIGSPRCSDLRAATRSPSCSPHFLPSGFRPAALALLGPSLERLVPLPFSKGS